MKSAFWILTLSIVLSFHSFADKGRGGGHSIRIGGERVFLDQYRLSVGDLCSNPRSVELSTDSRTREAFSRVESELSTTTEGVSPLLAARLKRILLGLVWKECQNELPLLTDHRLKGLSILRNTIEQDGIQEEGGVVYVSAGRFDGGTEYLAFFIRHEVLLEYLGFEIDRDILREANLALSQRDHNLLRAAFARVNNLIEKGDSLFDFTEPRVTNRLTMSQADAYVSIYPCDESPLLDPDVQGIARIPSGGSLLRFRREHDKRNQQVLLRSAGRTFVPEQDYLLPRGFYCLRSIFVPYGGRIQKGPWSVEINGQTVRDGRIATEDEFSIPLHYRFWLP